MHANLANKVQVERQRALGPIGLTPSSEHLGLAFQALRKDYKEHGRRYEKPLTWICELFLEDDEQISEAYSAR
jgi:hypothetical protein